VFSRYHELYLLVSSIHMLPTLSILVRDAFDTRLQRYLTSLMATYFRTFTLLLASISLSTFIVRRSHLGFCPSLVEYHQAPVLFWWTCLVGSSSQLCEILCFQRHD